MLLHRSDLNVSETICPICPRYVPKTAEELPVWNYDGSSTEQAPGSDSEVLISVGQFRVGSIFVNVTQVK